MTPQSPKAMTTLEIAHRIASLLNVDPYSSWNEKNFKVVVEEIKLAQEEARKEAYAQFRKDYRWACQCEEVDCGLIRDMLSRGATLLEKKGYAKGFSDGQVAMRERAAKEISEMNRGLIGTSREANFSMINYISHIALCVAALEPHAPEEGSGK